MRLKIILIAFVLCAFVASLAYAGGFTGDTIDNLVVNIVNKVMGSSETWVLSDSTARATFLSLTSGAGTCAIVAPATTGKFYFVRNSAAVAVTIKVSGGTGISIASGKTAVVIYNGSDYVRVTADSSF